MPGPRLFTMQMDPELHERLKIVATRRDRPMSEIVREAIREWLDLHVGEDEVDGNEEPRQWGV